MISANQTIIENLNAPVRAIKAKAELFNGSALVDTFSHENRIQEITIDRSGEDSKFFGFGICQKLNLKLIDKARDLNITTSHSFNITFDDVAAFPKFSVTEVNRDENTNLLSITAYDALEATAALTTGQVALEAPYTLGEFAAAIGTLMGLEVVLPALEMFEYRYSGGANLDGTESIREALNAIAEASQTIYFINGENKLVFKQLDRDGAAVFEIDREKIFELSSKTNKRLGTICAATELGDNVSISTTELGSTQYIRDNPFLFIDDIDRVLQIALDAVGGLTINQFTASWRGNYLVELGDKIALITKDNKKVYSFLLIDSVSYNGALEQSTEWSYTDNDAETASNPSSIGDALKQTFAKVDKVNKEINLLASDVSENQETISSLQLNTESISASVSSLEKSATDAQQELQELSMQVSAQMSAEEVKIEIQKELNNGVNKVVTATGFTFDESGLTVAKTGSEMETTITEDGMTVYKNNTAVLTANNLGVEAVNLSASTFLIIGTNSRLENYGSSRTGCFWIGG